MDGRGDAQHPLQRHGGASVSMSRTFGSTLEFTHWFANSKIVNRDGTPRVVYHGTTAAFDGFRPRKRRTTLGFHFGTLSQAEFFVGYRENARCWSGGNIRPAYLRIEHPLRMPDIFWRGRAGGEEIAEWLFKRGLIGELRLARIYNARTAPGAYQRCIDAIETAGYDGIVYANEHEGGTAEANEDAFVVFRLEQIRSIFHATGIRI